MLRTAQETAKIRILGLGNVLLGDEAFGPYAARTLEAMYVLGPDVAVVEAGTPGIDIATYLQGAEAAIILEAIPAEGEPGEVRLWRKQEVLRNGIAARHAHHDPSLKESLIALGLQEQCPADVLLVGVIPQRRGIGVGLSTLVRDAVMHAIQEVIRELERLGCTPELRPGPATPDIWWEKRITR